VGAGSNTSSFTLQIIGFYEKTQCWQEGELGHPVSGGYIYGDLIPEVGGRLEPETVKYGQYFSIYLILPATPSS
jgi:hypothetical protein